MVAPLQTALFVFFDHSVESLQSVSATPSQCRLKFCLKIMALASVGLSLVFLRQGWLSGLTLR